MLSSSLRSSSAFLALLLLLLPNRLSLPVAFPLFRLGVVFLFLAFSFSGGCPGGIPRLLLPPVIADSGS
jgi:hypothetical protein